MDGTRFDTWTRRRFGLATGGAVASLLGLSELLDADAKKKKRKRRKKRKKKDKCAKTSQPCDINVKKKRCCNENLDCAQVKDLSGDRCCKPLNSNCSKSTECCGTRVCASNRCQNAT